MEKTKEGQAVRLMERALKIMVGLYKTRELSIAMTNLETTLMWANKDRTIKGEFKPNSTHLQAE